MRASNAKIIFSHFITTLLWIISIKKCSITWIYPTLSLYSLERLCFFSRNNIIPQRIKANDMHYIERDWTCIYLHWNSNFGDAQLKRQSDIFWRCFDNRLYIYSTTKFMSSPARVDFKLVFFRYSSNLTFCFHNSFKVVLLFQYRGNNVLNNSNVTYMRMKTL